MLVTLTGAFKNSGDYLIGHRARTLLASHTEHEIVDINRKVIDDASYEIFNKARAVLLTGGPAYQAGIYPGVYDLDLDRIQVPVIPYGLGWKGKLGQDPKDFQFTEESKDFIKRIHQRDFFSSCRDYLTKEVLGNLGVENVAMTGCPAWYEESVLDQDFSWREVKTVVFSMPAVEQESVMPILKHLSKSFPKAKKYLVFNAGFVSTRSKDAQKISNWYSTVKFAAKLRGFESVSFESDFAKFQEIQSLADLHVGFRVHSHIFSVSKRIASVLIAEDSRGVGQLEAMGSEVLSAKQSSQDLIAAVDRFIESRGISTQVAVEKMRATHKTMLEFISQF